MNHHQLADVPRQSTKFHSELSRPFACTLASGSRSYVCLCRRESSHDFFCHAYNIYVPFTREDRMTLYSNSIAHNCQCNACNYISYPTALIGSKRLLPWSVTGLPVPRILCHWHIWARLTSVRMAKFGDFQATALCWWVGYTGDMKRRPHGRPLVARGQSVWIQGGWNTGRTSKQFALYDLPLSISSVLCLLPLRSIVFNRHHIMPFCLP